MPWPWGVVSPPSPPSPHPSSLHLSQVTYEALQHAPCSNTIWWQSERPSPEVDERRLSMMNNLQLGNGPVHEVPPLRHSLLNGRLMICLLVPFTSLQLPVHHYRPFCFTKSPSVLVHILIWIFLFSGGASGQYCPKKDPNCKILNNRNVQDTNKCAVRYRTTD